MPPLKALVTPCPNDTFCLLPWLYGKVNTDIDLNVEFADITDINEYVLSGKSEYDIVKCSYSQMRNIKTHYTPLHAAAAFSSTTGPIIITTPLKQKIATKQLRLAIPGFNTTAYTLLKTFCGTYKSIIVLPYEEMLEALHKNTVDCALVIHELQFMAEKAGFVIYCNLFDMWKEETALPLPLGGLFLKKNSFNTDKINNIIEDSIEYSYSNKTE
ncbi:hypothetical protein N9N03_02545, partial [Chlamydiia bacterium]|nr:hypothetical protein [Chlamydiia bacterium]